MSPLIKGVKHHDILEKTVYTRFISIITKQIQAQYFTGMTSLKLKPAPFTYIRTEKDHTPRLNAPSYAPGKYEHYYICEHVSILTVPPQMYH